MRVASEMRFELATFPDAVFPNDAAAFLTERDTPVERFKRNLLIISSSIYLRALES